MKLSINFCRASLFTWEGDHSRIEKLATELEPLAAGTGHSGMTIPHNVLRSVGKARSPAEETTERVQWLGFTHGLLQTDTNHPAHPGEYADYAPAWHFEFNLLSQADDKGMEVEVLGDPFACLRWKGGAVP